MKFVSFNINGLRARIHQLEAIINKLNPDVIGLQETKVHDSFFPIQEISQFGYYVYYHGQKKHHGVALLLRKIPIKIIKGFTNNETTHALTQKRVIIAHIMTSIGMLSIINSYCPQGGHRDHPEKFPYKKNFYQNLQNYIQHNYDNKSLLLVMGDMNISPTNLDIGIGEESKKRWIKSGKCSFLPEERKWMQKLINWGLIDIYRNTHITNNQRYSWFSYRSQGFHKKKGLRIDFILVTHPIAKLHIDNNICYDIREMDKPSDHAPIWAEFKI